MKKILLIISILLSSVYYSCKPKTAKEQLTSDLLKSKTFNDYFRFCGIIARGIKTNRYNKDGVDRNYIKSRGAVTLNLPRDTLYHIYTTAKMTNAKEYINTLLAIDSTSKVLLKEFPGLKEMNSLDRLRYLISVHKQMPDFKSK